MFLCAALPILVTAVYVAVASALSIFASAEITELVLACAVFVAGGLALSAIAALIAGALTKIPAVYLCACFSFIGGASVHFMTAGDAACGIIIAVLVTIFLFTLSGAAAGALWYILSQKQRPVSAALPSGAALLLLLFLITNSVHFFFSDGSPRGDVSMYKARQSPLVPQIRLADPSQKGRFAVKKFTYASYPSKRPVHYSSAAPDVITNPVDGSPLVGGWSASRTRYWGHDAHELPLNATVWMPGGEGPFPLVLIVHGDAPMQVDSDSGYTYLAELLASRGFIAVSIDERFLNFSAAEMFRGEGLCGENDLRGWLLLEHLKLWRERQKSKESLFFGRADMSRIALIGHSRGGEAVAVAAFFNTLACSPEDESLRFDYGFGIRSVIALAPAEGQYEPNGRDLILTDVNHLTLHGTHDMDVSSFVGLRQFDRVRFTGERLCLKSAIAIGFANHGQFNERWGRRSDTRNPVTRLFNIAQLISGDEQRKIAEVYISAFVECTLNGINEYGSIFIDSRRAEAWLPGTPVYSQFFSSNIILLQNFEYIDVAGLPARDPGAVKCCGGASMSIVRAKLKSEQRCTELLEISWKAEGSHSPSVTIAPSGAIRAQAGDALFFSAALANEGGDARPADFTIELRDRKGNAASLPLHDFGDIRPPLPAYLTKRKWMQSLPIYETHLQSYCIPLACFLDNNGRFDIGAITQMRLLFDKSKTGNILIDDAGIMKGR